MELLNGLGIPELTKPELTGDWEFQLRLVQRRQKSRDEFMAGIQEITRHIVDRAKKFELDTIPGDFGVLKERCPKCGGEVHERYKAFQCVQCDFSIWKIISGRLFEGAEIEQLIHNRQVGPLQGFRSRMGKPFAAILKLNAEHKVEFDFGPDSRNGEGSASAEIDFTGQEPVGKCPKCQHPVYEAGMSYVCEKSVGANRSCDFRLGKVILQQPVDRPQAVRLLETGKTDLLTKFISKKGRPFKAFLVTQKGKVAFEFEARQARVKKGKAAEAKAPPAKVDFTGQQSIGKCPKCDAPVFETEAAYLCEQSQAEKRPCKFKISKAILQQPIERAQAAKLLAESKTDLLKNFISKAGRPFSAHLVMDDMGKITFEFPPREERAPDEQPV
jgi:DNA topoisomerase-3